MRKKLDTRFPAARIKKIMQSDEDVGKIAMTVPLLVSKALELFLQDLCDRTYEITLRRGAKTMSSYHLKQCVQSFNVFDFLKDIVSKVPDLGGHAVSGDDRTVCKRRKVDDDGNDSEDDAKRNKMPENAHHTGGGRGRGQGRGRGRGRGSRTTDRENNAHVKSEHDHHHADASKHHDIRSHSNESMEISTEHEVKPSISKSSEACFRNFDLNMDPVEEDSDSPTSVVPAPPCPPEKPTTTRPPEKPTTICRFEKPTATCLYEKPTIEFRHEEIPGWSLSDVEKMAIDPIHLVNMNRRMDEEDEDYDEEES